MQMTLIHSLSFLHSATFPAYLSVMLAWFLGSALGCWLPSHISSTPLMVLAATAHTSNTLLLREGWSVGSWLLAALLGGVAGGHWVRRWGQRDLAHALSWESLGLACGFFICAFGVYRFGLGTIYLVPPGVTLAVVWRERGLYAAYSRI